MGRGRPAIAPVSARVPELGLTRGKRTVVYRRIGSAWAGTGAGQVEPGERRQFIRGRWRMVAEMLKERQGLEWGTDSAGWVAPTPVVYDEDEEEDEEFVDDEEFGDAEEFEEEDDDFLEEDEEGVDGEGDFDDDEDDDEL
jgi:hypothetical protein